MATNEVLTQGQSYTDPAGRTGTVNFDTGTGQPLAAGATTNSNVISSASLAPVAPLDLSKTYSTSTDNGNGMVAGANSYAADYKAATDFANNQVTPDNQNKADSINSMLTDLGIQDANKGSDQLATENALGIPTMKTDLANVNADILSKTAARDKAISDAELNAGKTGQTWNMFLGTQGAIQRGSAAEIGLLQSKALGLQGNLTAAQDTANRAIDLKYHDIEANITTRQKQLDALKPLLDAEEKKKADAQQYILNKQAQDVADKKQAEKDNTSLAQGWAKSALDSNQPTLASQISSLDPTSATFKSDLATLQAKINPNNSLDSQYKIMQIKELAQKISDAKKVTDLGGLVSPVSQLPDGTYDTAAQNTLLSQMSPSDAALVKAVGNYTMDISKVTSLRSDQRQLLAQKVAMVYPGFDMTNYATHAAYRKSLAGTAAGTVGGAINSANKVINHLTSYVDNVNKLSNTAIGGGIGELINSTKSNLLRVVSPSMQTAKGEAQTDATGVKDELAKFFKGSGVADVHTIDDWSKTVNVDASPASQKGAVQGAIELLQGQLVPMMDQYKQTMGTNPPDGLFLKSDTVAKLSNLKNQGYKIDIPGVNYTDKSAWLKYGGGTQDSWNTAVDNLTKAGLPLTNENILQASQL